MTWLVADEICAFDEREWLVHGSPVITTEPWGAKNTALEGAQDYFEVPEEAGKVPKVCVEVLGTNVVITRIHFTAEGVDLVNVTLYKADKVTPIQGQVIYSSH